MPNFRKFLNYHKALDNFKKDYGSGRRLPSNEISPEKIEYYIDYEYLKDEFPIDRTMRWATTSTGQNYWEKLNAHYRKYKLNDKLK